MQERSLNKPLSLNVGVWAAPALVLILATVAHFLLGPVLGIYWSRVAIDVAIAVLMAVSLNIVNGFTGQFSIGHAAFYAIGGYAAACVTYYGSLLIWNSTAAFSGDVAANTVAPFVEQQVLFIVAMLIGGIVAAVAGWLVGLPSLRLRGDYLAIVTLGFGEIVRVLLQQTGDQFYDKADFVKALPGGLWPPPVGRSLGFTNIPRTTTLFMAVLAAGVCVLFAWRLKKSTFGRSMIAIRENEIAAEAMGVNVTRLKVWAFVLAAFFAGVAGALYAHEPGTQLQPIDAGFARSIDVVIMVVLGGLGSISGAVVAAIGLTVANEWLREPTPVWYFAVPLLLIRVTFWQRGRVRAGVTLGLIILLIEGARLTADYFSINLGDYRMIIYAMTLILLMILRPKGLFGLNEVTDLFKRSPQQSVSENDDDSGNSGDVVRGGSTATLPGAN